MYKIKIDALWIIIFVLISIMILLFLSIFIIFCIIYIQNRFDIIFVCRGLRLCNNRLIIPLFCIYRHNRNNNNNLTKIIPVKIYSDKEYCERTGNILIIDPNNNISIGVNNKN